MERNPDNILLSTSAAWSPLYEAYHAISETYQVDFVMQSIEPGCNTYINTDYSDLLIPKTLYQDVVTQVCFGFVQCTSRNTALVLL